MRLLLTLLSLSLFFCPIALVSENNSWQGSDGSHEDIQIRSEVKGTTTTEATGNDDEILEDFDFEDDSGTLVEVDVSSRPDVKSVMHLHNSRGEVFVPCFGMWWPVGGPAYDYVGDYYGDYRKRRRMRKQKKAARTKRKKS